MDRPRRVHHDIDYKVTRELEKEKEKDNNLDPFGFNDNNYLNEVGDFEEEPKKISGGTASWLEDTDKLNLPSRFYNTNAKSSSGLNYKEKNLIHGRDNLFDRTNSCNLSLTGRLVATLSRTSVKRPLRRWAGRSREASSSISRTFCSYPRSISPGCP